MNTNKLPHKQNKFIQNRKEIARQEFERLVVPLLVPLLCGTEYASNERATTQRFNEIMDFNAGIDGIIFNEHTKKSMTVANHIQWVPPSKDPWNSFTLRLNDQDPSQSEWNKRMSAIGPNGRGNGAYPEYTVQGFCTLPHGRGQLLSLGIIRTRHLVEAAARLNNDGVNSLGWGIQRSASSSFLWISWDLLGKLAYPLSVYTVQNPKQVSFPLINTTLG